MDGELDITYYLLTCYPMMLTLNAKCRSCAFKAGKEEITWLVHNIYVLSLLNISCLLCSQSEASQTKQQHFLPPLTRLKVNVAPGLSG